MGSCLLKCLNVIEVKYFIDNMLMGKMVEILEEIWYLIVVMDIG